MKKIIILIAIALLTAGCAKSDLDSTDIQNVESELVEEQQNMESESFDEEQTIETESVEEQQEVESEPFDEQQNDEDSMFLHMMPPKHVEELFLPGIVSTEHFEHSALTIVDENTLLWSRFDQPVSPDSIHNIMISTYDGEQWEEPAVVEWSNENSEDSPFYYDGTVFFHVKMEKFFLAAYDLKSKTQSIIEIPGADTSLVYPTKFEDTLIFNMATDSAPESVIAYSTFSNGYSEAKILLSDTENEYLNINPHISSDGKMLLYGSVNRPDGKGACDLYVSFKDDEGNWSAGINLEKVNTSSNERFPSLSPDGKYLFFVSNRSINENIGSQTKPQNGLGDVYWIDASFIYELNPYK